MNVHNIYQGGSRAREFLYLAESIPKSGPETPVILASLTWDESAINL